MSNCSSPSTRGAALGEVITRRRPHRADADDDDVKGLLHRFRATIAINSTGATYDDQQETDDALGTGRQEYGLISVWWD